MKNYAINNPLNLYSIHFPRSSWSYGERIFKFVFHPGASVMFCPITKHSRNLRKKLSYPSSGFSSHFPCSYYFLEKTTHDYETLFFLVIRALALMKSHITYTAYIVLVNKIEWVNDITWIELVNDITWIEWVFLIILVVPAWNITLREEVLKFFAIKNNKCCSNTASLNRKR